METKIIISKFWTRVWALLIDSIVLGIIGYLLGFTIQDFLINIGNYGVIFGLIITVAYQTFCNSNLLNGQTIGKRFMNIKVVDINGDTISLGKSFIRSLILSVPYFTYNLTIPGLSETSFISMVKTIGLFSIVLGVVVIYIFNKQTRQSLHDLIVNTYVATRDENEEPSIIAKVTNTPFYVSGGLIALLIAISIYISSGKVPELKNISNIYTIVSDIDGVTAANISINTNYGNNVKTISFIAQLWVKTLPEDELENNELVRESVRIILKNESKIDNFDVIVISLNRGFNIGIASQKTTKTVSYSPSKWKEILQ